MNSFVDGFGPRTEPIASSLKNVIKGVNMALKINCLQF